MHRDNSEWKTANDESLLSTEINQNNRFILFFLPSSRYSIYFWKTTEKIRKNTAHSHIREAGARLTFNILINYDHRQNVDYYFHTVRHHLCAKTTLREKETKEWMNAFHSGWTHRSCAPGPWSWMLMCYVLRANAQKQSPEIMQRKRKSWTILYPLMTPAMCTKPVCRRLRIMRGTFNSCSSPDH